MTTQLTLTGDADADRLLSDNPLALLVGMLLDQQVPMEWAFTSPLRLAERLGDRRLDAATIAEMDSDLLEEVFRQRPALHRYPGSMARRVHTLCEHLVAEHGGRAEAVWDGARTGQELFRRVSALPGFGRQKAQIFTALLAKQCGVAPEGWREVTGDYGAGGHRSIADVTGPESLEKVRDYKRAKKAGST